MNSSRNRPLLGPPLERGVKKILGVPFFIKGTVIKGFGRGSKELGIPTANLNPQQFPQIIEQIPPGVYFGWSRLKFQDGVLSSIYKMAMNIGWNPFFKNEKKSVVKKKK